MAAPDVRAMHLWFRYGAWPKQRRRSRFGASGGTARQCCLCLDDDEAAFRLMPTGCRCESLVHWGCFEKAVVAANNPAGNGGQYKSWCKCPVCELRYQGVLGARASARWVVLAAGTPAQLEARLSVAEHDANLGNTAAAYAAYTHLRGFVTDLETRLGIVVSMARIHMLQGSFGKAVDGLKNVLARADIDHHAGLKRRASGLLAEATSLQARAKLDSLGPLGELERASCFYDLHSAVRMQRRLALALEKGMAAELDEVLRRTPDDTSRRDERKKELQYEMLLALTRLAHETAALERYVPEGQRKMGAALSAMSAYDAAVAYAMVQLGSLAFHGISPLVLSLRHGRAMCTGDAAAAQTELRGVVEGYTRLYDDPLHPPPYPLHPLLLQAQADLASLASGSAGRKRPARELGPESSRAGAARRTDDDEPESNRAGAARWTGDDEPSPARWTGDDEPESSRAGAARWTGEEESMDEEREPDV
jgi:hypothetical protein